MSFTYTTDIPAAGNNPSTDQTPLQVNTNTVSDCIQVDHVAFNNSDCGKHNRVTFPTYRPQGVQTGDASVMFTEAGAENLNAQLKFKNSSGPFPASLIKAYGVYAFTNASTSIAAVGSQELNSVVLSATAPATNRRILNFTIDTTASGINNNNVGVLVSVSPSSVDRDINITYSFSGTTLTFNVFNNTASQAPGDFKLSFIIMQV